LDVGHAENKENIRVREKKIDDAIDKTFPASDPTATGHATGTEAPARPVDREAPVITKEEIEEAQKGAGHKQNDSSTS
jgi:hypothetical protein